MYYMLLLAPVRIIVAMRVLSFPHLLQAVLALA